MENFVDIKIDGKILKIESKKWAKQSNGSVVLRYMENVMLITANMKEETREEQDFFPLTVDFRINSYSAGKIPGGFFKREGKPSEREILLSRLIDRPLRPLFPENFFNDTQIIAMLLSADLNIDFDAMGIIGASAALLSSTLPFSTPVSAVKIGAKNGNYFVNPGFKELKEMEMVLMVAGTEENVVMIEAGGKEFGESTFKEGLELAKNIIKDICIAQKVLINEDKFVVAEDEEFNDIFKTLEKKYSEDLKDAIFSTGKADRKAKIRKIQDIIESEIENEELKGKYKNAFHKLEYVVFRKTLLKEKKRNDGRKFNEIRNISIELGVLPRAHGSAVFTRGETQSLATVTLGSEDDAKRVDDIFSSSELKRFMLHYNFPPFSVGEVGFLRGPGRREIGHGNLAEKALSFMIPSQDSFPYTIRIVSDILESNGSSSMATVCGGSLALMNAGVPISAPVAGIAMGLVKEGDDFAVLTDIAGYEDHFGDMDFKITGTEKGITAAQLDIKISGLTEDVINKTLEDAKNARLFILSKMKENIDHPSDTLSEYAPVITNMKIKEGKIRDLIGPGGKTIKGLIAEYDVKINADDDGNVAISASNKEIADKVKEKIKEITQSVEVNKIYNGKITRIEDYGIFVELFKGAVSLVHISEISHKRIGNIRDEHFKIGQEMKVKVIDVDRDNKIKASIKALEQRKPYEK